jgi:hypothetical protein
MVTTYDSLGYKLVEIPPVSVEGGVGFVLQPKPVFYHGTLAPSHPVFQGYA